MYSRGNMLGSMGHADGYDLGSKRQRLLDDDPYYRPSSTYRSSYGYGSSMGYGSGGGGGGSGSGGVSGGSSRFPVVRLRGLPFDCTEADIQDFFAGLDIVDVLMVHKRGRFSGEGYVVFSLPMQVEFALQRDKHNMGRRYIEVFRCKKQEYYHAVAAEVSDSRNYRDEEPPVKAPPLRSSSKSVERDDVEHTGVLRLRGLPFSVTKADIIEFFGDTGLTEENIHIVTMSEGRATGEAFVEFSRPDEAKSAMKKDKMTLGSRYVELFPSSREEATRLAAKSRQ